MLRGFKLNTENIDYLKYSEEGLRIYESNKKVISKSLKQFLKKDNSLDGEAIQNSWFPQIEADVFISHSHTDKDLAINLSGWLKEELNIHSFVDSTVWDYSIDLLREIDNEFCRSDDKKTYNYKIRNYSTSHVYMMLAAALAKMIDSTECLFFIFTDNSIKLIDDKIKTISPWIYFEILMSQLLQKKNKRYSHLTEEKQLVVYHQPNMGHLTSLDSKQLKAWKHRAKGERTGSENLRLLYELYPEPSDDGNNFKILKG